VTGALTVHAPSGIGEVTEGTDLAALVLTHCPLADGDVVTVTSKVVSKAEGRMRYGDREASLAEETRRVVARRGATTIVRNRLGLTMAAAGIDASNVPAGRHLLLPRDPDATARRLRTELADRAGVNVAVVVTDTAGRAWRTGQTDIAIGAAGLRVVEDLAGAVDPHGNPLAVTAPAVADELAGAAELVTGKLGGRPVAVLRGRADLVLPAGDDGPGAAALVRADGEDMFGLGAREAVLQALAGQRGGFGAPATAEEVREAAHALLSDTAVLTPDGAVRILVPDEDPSAAAVRSRAEVLATACGWTCAEEAASPGWLRILPGTP